MRTVILRLEKVAGKLALNISGFASSQRAIGKGLVLSLSESFIKICALTLIVTCIWFAPAQAQMDAALPFKEDVAQSERMAIDGVWRVSTINKRLRIEAGRAYVIDPWVHAFIMQVKPDMVTIQNIQRLGPGVFIADDLPLMGQARFKLRPDGNLDARVAGAFGPAKYQLIKENVDDQAAFQAELSATDFGSDADFDNVGTQPAQKLETWHVFVQKAWCTGRGHEVALVKSAEGTVSVEAYKGGNSSRPVTTGDKKISVKCKRNFDTKTYKYDDGDAGLLVLTGTREQISSYILDYELSVRYTPSNRRKRWGHKKSFKRPNPLKNGLDVGKSQTLKWFAGIKNKPDVTMKVKFERVK